VEQAGELLLIRAPTKNCGVGNGDPNLRSQPRLPGSVVGEPSMRQGREADKITEGIVLK
jgi:hypothetical protein